MYIYIYIYIYMYIYVYIKEHLIKLQLKVEIQREATNINELLILNTTERVFNAYVLS